MYITTFLFIFNWKFFWTKYHFHITHKILTELQNCPIKLNVQSKHNFGHNTEFHWITVKSTIGWQPSQTTEYFLMQRNNLVYNNKWDHWTWFMCTDKTANLCTHLEVCKHWSLRQDMKNAVHISHLFQVLHNVFHGWMRNIVVTSYAAQLCSEI